MTSANTPDMSNIPDHVPAELVLPIGLAEGPEFLAAPHEFMAGLHDTHPPVFFSPQQHNRQSWMLTRHEDCFFVLRNPELFTTAGATPFPRDPDNYFYFIPLEIDPPHHRKYRNILNPIFSPASIAKMEQHIRDVANGLIDRFVDRGECEFTTEFGRPLPVSVFLELMGLPQDKIDTFVEWAMGLLHSQDRDIAARCMQEIAAYLSEVIEEKTREPDGRVISTIVHAAPEGEPLSEREIFGFVFFLFIGGLDTVFATLNNVFRWLAENPAGRRQIIDEPDNIGNVVEELLRAYSVTFSGRTLTCDHELRGVNMKKGDKVNCVLPAANYDPHVFENPRKIDFHRPRKPNLAFAGGVHSCMGAHLARMEMKVCISEFLRRIPDFAIREGTRIEYWPGGVVGPKRLPLTW